MYQIFIDRVKFFEIFENKFCDLFSKVENGSANTSDFRQIEELDIAEASTLWSKALDGRKIFKTKNHDASSWSHAVMIFVSDFFVLTE